MSCRIRYSPQALRNLDAVWDDVWEASRDDDTAERYLTELLDHIEAKREYPESGIPLHYRGLFTGFYSVNYKAYKAFYRIRDGHMDVARILLAKQDYIAKLFET